MKPLPRLLSAMLALASVIWSLPQGLLVLCAGENGHLAVEFLHPAEQGTSAEGAATWAHDCTCRDGCGPCHDTRVGPEISASRLERRLETPELRPFGPVGFAAVAARISARMPRASLIEPELPAPGWIRHQETLRLLV